MPEVLCTEKRHLESIAAMSDERKEQLKLELESIVFQKTKKK